MLPSGLWSRHNCKNRALEHCITLNTCCSNCCRSLLSQSCGAMRGLQEPSHVIETGMRVSPHALQRVPDVVSVAYSLVQELIKVLIVAENHMAAHVKQKPFWSDICACKATSF